MNLQNKNTHNCENNDKEKNKLGNKKNLKSKNAFKFESTKQRCDEAPKNQ